MIGTAPLSPWRRLWLGLPLTYKLVLFGLVAVMTATLAVLVVTYTSAGDSLKLQMERQLSRDLNVCEKWYRVRLEELQLTAVGLARHQELTRALATGRPGDAAALLQGEVGRLQPDIALLVDGQGRPIWPAGAAGRFDPKGIVSAAIARHEPIVTTEAWRPQDVQALPAAQREPGLARLVVMPLGTAGALILGDRVGERCAVPTQMTAMIGGALALTDLGHVVAWSGFPDGRAPALRADIWAGVRAGRYFYTEQDLGGRTYLLAVRPLVDAHDQTVGAMVRGFPESEITETLERYAGSISLLSAAAVIFSLVALLGVTRRLLLPLGRLARISASLAAGDAVEVPAGAPGADELAAISHGVGQLAERLVQHDRLRGQLIEKIITAQEDERKRIARELHDQTGQALTGLLVGLKVLEGARSLDEMRERAAELKVLTLATLEDVHELSVALRPAMLDDLGLPVALRALVKSFAAQHGVNARCHADALDERLPGLWEVTLYRIVQEALTNVAKYAVASEVEVVLREDAQGLTLSVADNGRGFEPGAVGKDGREHLGLLGMQERVALLGSAIRLESAPGRGTRIEVRVSRPPHGPEEARGEAHAGIG